MVYIAIEIATVVFEVLLIQIYVKGLFLRRLNTIPYFSILTTLGVGFCIICLSPLPVAIRLAYTFCSILIFAVIAHEAKLLSAFWDSIIFCAVMSLADIICMGLLGIFGLSNLDLMSYGNSRAVFIISAKLFDLLLIALRLSLSRRTTTTLPFKKLVLLFPCQFVSIYLCYVLLEEAHRTGRDFPVSFVVILAGLMYVNVLLVIYAENSKNNEDLKRQKEFAEKQCNLQLKYYDQLRHTSEEMRSHWHDIEKHMMAMKSMVNAGFEDTAQNYIEEFQDTVSKINRVVDVGNPAVSAILNHYVHTALVNHIDVKMDVSIANNLLISAVDLSIIIGNTFENAIDACLRLDKSNRYIKVVMKKKNDMLFYEIKNPYIEASHKKSGGFHGYGLKNVAICVRKYCGVMNKDTVDGNFFVSIRLNC